MSLTETFSVGDAVERLHALPASSLASQFSVALIVILGLIESGWLLSRRAWFDKLKVGQETVTAAVMGLGGLLVGGALAGLFATAFIGLQRLAPPSTSELWAQYPLVGFASAFLAWDLVGYFYHWLGHRTAVGWAAHRPHHTGRYFSLSLAWRQSWLPVHAVVLPLVALGGWPLSTIVICAAVSNVMQALQHTTTPVRAPRWLRAIVMTPLQHRHHHLSSAAPVNLGPVFTVWDRIAGTYVDHALPSDATYGVSETANPLRVQFDGWAELATPKPTAVSVD